MPLQANQGNFQSRGHVRETELWFSGSGFILKIPTINYKKFKELKTNQERDTRNSGDYSMVLTINKHMELWKLIWTL